MTMPKEWELAEALRAAASAHHEYETNAHGGQRDHRWAEWYAAYVLGRLGDFTTPTKLCSVLIEARGDDWAEAAAKHVLMKLG